MEIQLGSTPVTLLPKRAAFLKSSGTLIIADLHLGKSATFRTRGIAVPEGTTESDLNRITKLLSATGASHLVIAGDLVHSADGLTSSILSRFDEWLKSMGLPVTLTEGNHDARASFSRRQLPLETVDRLIIDGILITHDPDHLPSEIPGIAGHLHPGVRIREAGRSSIRIPGFFLKNDKHLVLPAFSEFTGIHPVKVSKSDRFFAELSGQVTEIPAKILR